MNGAVLPYLGLLYYWQDWSKVLSKKKDGGDDSKPASEGFMVRNTYIYPPGLVCVLLPIFFEYTSQNMPKFNSISISGYHITEAGATDIEMAYTLADS